MKKRFSLPSFLSGVFAAVLVAAMVMPAVAATVKKNIDVYTGIKVYVNDQLIEPKDAGGNPVEPFVYNGTTYLPIRAIGNALGMAVDYEGSTNSAYIGKHSSDKPAVWLADMDYFYSNGNVYTEDVPVKDNYEKLHYHSMYCNYSSAAPNNGAWSRTYNLNGNYSKITGTMFISYEDRSVTVKTGSGIELYGDGELLYTNRASESTKGFAPIDFDVNLTGVLKLEVKLFAMPDYSNFGHQRIYLGDCGLWT